MRPLHNGGESRSAPPPLFPSPTPPPVFPSTTPGVVGNYSIQAADVGEPSEKNKPMLGYHVEKRENTHIPEMESIYRLLLHEQSLVQGDHIDGQLLSSIECHRRDLATTLETAKWQLEDFEREVMAGKSQVKQNVIGRHMQFIGAIREQIFHVEQSMGTSLGNSLRNINLNEQDRDGFALFLSGKEPLKHIADQESEDNNILRRFLDPAVSSSSKEDIDEKKAGETEANYGRYDEEGAWDLEANEAKGKDYLQKNKLKGYNRRMNIFGSVGNFLSTQKMRVTRSFTKRLKDGEEQGQSPLFTNVHPGMQLLDAAIFIYHAHHYLLKPHNQVAVLGIIEKNARDHYIASKLDIIRYHLSWRCF
ncbi:hypothetical protein DH2020_039900 [Rehmannia glutinosa]|uniref:Syntaxin 6/10/61 N-terminal domain-containing protein n=1 Tax=Rehmannia glutinosa TaxID=99300 RepID=A0ABR0UV49_REHGL